MDKILCILLSVLSILFVILIIKMIICNKAKKKLDIYSKYTSPYLMDTLLNKNLSTNAKLFLNSQIPNGTIKIKSNLPEYFDLRKIYGYKITQPLDQGTCGSCWAFATCSALTDRGYIAGNDGWVKKKYGRNIKMKLDNTEIETTDFLSPYFLAGCDYCNAIKENKDLYKIYVDNNFCNQECGGGLIEYAMIFAHKVGLISYSCGENPLSYKCQSLAKLEKGKIKGPKGGTCGVVYFKEPYRVDTGKTDDENEKLIMSEIMEHGTVVTGIEVYENFMNFNFKPSISDESYKNFDSKYIYTKTDGNMVGGHAICIIGWGTATDGTKYWICKNSWGRKWGDNGYFRILRGTNFIDEQNALFICQLDTDRMNKEICTYADKDFSDDEYFKYFGCKKPKID